MNDILENKIKNFFQSEAFGVVSASNNKTKYGNKVLRCYLQHQKNVYPVNPHQKTIEGLSCIDSIENLPQHVKSISIITPPTVTENVVKQAIAKGIKNIWMQPGAESEMAVSLCQANKINIISGGPCILVILGFYEIQK